MTSRPLLSALSLIGLALTLLVSPGCSLLEYLDDVPRPKISFQSASINKLSWQSADVKLDFKLDNPYPVAINVTGYQWQLKVSGKEFLSGNQSKKVAVNAQKSSTIPLPFTLKFADLLARISEAKGEEDVPYQLGGKITIETPVGPVTLPLNASGDLPVLSIPAVRLTTITAKLQGMTKLIVGVNLGMKHQNGYKLKLSELKYNFKIEGYSVAAGKVKPAQTVPNSGETIIEIPIEIDLVSASSALISSITSGKFKYALSTDLGLDTPFGTAPLSFAEDGTLKLY